MLKKRNLWDRDRGHFEGLVEKLIYVLGGGAEEAEGDAGQHDFLEIRMGRIVAKSAEGVRLAGLAFQDCTCLNQTSDIFAEGVGPGGGCGKVV